MLESRTEDEQRVHVPEQRARSPACTNMYVTTVHQRVGSRGEVEAERALHDVRANDRQLQEQNRDVDRDQRLHGGGHPRIVLLVRRRVGHRSRRHWLSRLAAQPDKLPRRAAIVPPHLRKLTLKHDLAR